MTLQPKRRKRRSKKSRARKAKQRRRRAQVVKTIADRETVMRSRAVEAWRIVHQPAEELRWFPNAVSDGEPDSPYRASA